MSLGVSTGALDSILTAETVEGEVVLVVVAVLELGCREEAAAGDCAVCEADIFTAAVVGADFLPSLPLGTTFCNVQGHVNVK